jgi:hypothetical protein
MQPGQPSFAATRSKRKSFWLIIVGAALIVVGAVMASLIFFTLSVPPTGNGFGFNYVIPLDVAYLAAGIGYVLAGVGALLALLGIAFRGRT